MWIRKCFDIDWRDLAHACWRALTAGNSGDADSRLTSLYGSHGLVCLSVRSAWDLLLQSLALPPGSEVLMSAITVPDMAAIARHHQLRVTPIDLDPVTVVPCLDSLARASSPQSRILLVAHLFGSRFPVAPFAKFAKERGMILVEDCAQAYSGPQYHGDHAADASLFSFGPIKAATALGGAIAVVRDEPMLAEMRRRQQQYPQQSRWSYWRRTLKYAVLKGLSARGPCTLLFAVCRLMGNNPDRLINGAVRNFSREGLLRQLRLRPSSPLLELLARRLTGKCSSNWQRKAEQGAELRDQLEESVPCPGVTMQPHSFWVFPVLSSHSERLILALRERGFDATQGQSLAVIDPPKDCPELEPRVARTLLRQIVFLPLHAEMRREDLHKMATLIRQVEPGVVNESMKPGESLLDAPPV